MDVEVTRGVIASLHREAARAAPEECCGLLLGDANGPIDSICAARNVAADPLRRFEIDPHVLLAAHKAARDGGPQVRGYYHSHPHGSSLPSATDKEHSTGDCRIWAIIAGRDIAFWRDRGNGFDELTCRMA